MNSNISATGYTNVILVLNMKRFIADKDKLRFETARGSGEFASSLRRVWPARIEPSQVFLTMEQDKKRQGNDDSMSTEEVGFATGIFRSLYLEQYAFPTYSLDKACIKFPESLEENFQFRNLFRRAWDEWSVYIRPSVSGMFVIRLTRLYKTPRELIKIAEDTIDLQDSLDVQSARRWLARKELELKDNPAGFERARSSLKGFLDWLGSDHKNESELLYNPVQWKIAMEVLNHFVGFVRDIPLAGQEPIQLVAPLPSLSMPLHDSYVVHHLDEVYVDKAFAQTEGDALPRESSDDGDYEATAGVAHRQTIVTASQINRTPALQHALINLLHGTILLEAPPGDNGDPQNTESSRRYFPDLRWPAVENILEANQASWMDEICLFTQRTALIIPARKSRNDHLLVSTVPGATLRVKYLRYWGAIERMIEFTVEIRALSQLVERASYRLLDDIAKRINTTRSQLFAGDVQLDKDLPELVSRANQLRRFAAMAQGLSDPLVWCRAEYSINKAQYVLDQLGVPVLLQHIERNMNSLNGVVDHVDELYAMDLAEKSNDLSAVLTLVLAGMSFILTLIMLPSFWTDTQSIDVGGRLSAILQEPFLRIVGYGGTIVASLLILFSLVIGIAAVGHWRKITRIIMRSLSRLDR